MGVADALRMMNAGLDYLNGPGAGELDAAACGLVLRSLGEIEAKFTAAHASVLSRFDAADAHDCDGYGTSATWLTAMADMTPRDAKAKMREMRLLRDHPGMADALAARDISKSQALAIAEWTRKLPAELRAETIKILVQAAAAGASLDDLRMIAAVALEKWRASRPDADEDGFDDRYVQAGTTFQGAGVIRGNLTPECAAAVQAVLEALGKKAGPEDPRTEGQRFHDALQQGCSSLGGGPLTPGPGLHRCSLHLIEETAGLVLPESGVRAVEAEQFLVGTLLDDPPVVEDDQLVHARDRAQPVRDDQRGPAFHEPPQRLLDEDLAFRVQRACRLIE
jgi:hypothetical protein